MITAEQVNLALNVGGLSAENQRIYFKMLEDAFGVTDEYYVDQWAGYAEDDYHGELYFKTNVPGQYVRVHFDM